MKNKNIYLLSTTLIIFVLLCSACNLGSKSSDTPDADQLSTIVAATMQSMQVSQPAQDTAIQNQSETIEPNNDESTTTLLQNSIYYLKNDSTEITQLWKLEKDGITQTQITNETTPIEDYHLSPFDKSIVYLTNNQLFKINSDHSEHTLIIDGSQADKNQDTFYYYQKISHPRWSPDGSIIAFARGGLNFYHINTDETALILPNEIETMDSGTLRPTGIYSPEQFSPDGSKLLLEVGWFEGGTKAVYDIAANKLIELQHQGILCCESTWSTDGNTILVSSANVGMISPGMWKFDSNTGQETILIPSQESDGSYNLAGWPAFLSNTEIQFFYKNTAGAAPGDTSLTIVQSSTDDINTMNTLFSEYIQINEAVWSPDHSQVFIVRENPDSSQYPDTGDLLMISLGGSQPQTLIEDVHHINISIH